VKHADEEWRRNPDRRQAAYDLHTRWVAAADAAETHLVAALDGFQYLPLPGDAGMPALLRTLRVALLRALVAAEQVPRTPASEILVGDMAAYGIGYEVER
jgi:hypothetical protein